MTTQLSPLFGQVVGTDLSSAMYNSAPALDNVKAGPLSFADLAISLRLICHLGSVLQYDTADSASLPSISSESVDLVTAGTSAHWFDHPAWWKEMTRIVKRGGTVACWTFTPGFMLGTSTSPAILLPLFASIS